MLPISQQYQYQGCFTEEPALERVETDPCTFLHSIGSGHNHLEQRLSSEEDEPVSEMLLQRSDSEDSTSYGQHAPPTLLNRSAVGDSQLRALEQQPPRAIEFYPRPHHAR